jgi:hypothetical protein
MMSIFSRCAKRYIYTLNFTDEGYTEHLALLVRYNKLTNSTERHNSLKVTTYYSNIPLTAKFYGISIVEAVHVFSMFILPLVCEQRSLQAV